MSYEAVLNEVIKNGQAIQDSIGGGTVLPTAKSLACSDRYAAEQERLNRKAARSLPANCKERRVQGETRYYTDETHYAVVSHQRAKWFEVRADGDYAIKLSAQKSNCSG